MTNLTLSIDEEELKQARILALQQGTSLNAVIREFVRNYIGQTKHYQKLTESILFKAEQSDVGSQGRKWTRDELYE